MSDDIEILLIKIEQKLGRICKALEHGTKDDVNNHSIDSLMYEFPLHREAGMAREYFERTLGDHDAMNVGVESDTYQGAVDMVQVPIGAARNLFIVGWQAAMKNVRKRFQP